MLEQHFVKDEEVGGSVPRTLDFVSVSSISRAERVIGDHQLLPNSANTQM